MELRGWPFPRGSHSRRMKSEEWARTRPRDLLTRPARVSRNRDRRNPRRRRVVQTGCPGVVLTPTTRFLRRWVNEEMTTSQGPPRYPPNIPPGRLWVGDTPCKIQCVYDQTHKSKDIHWDHGFQAGGGRDLLQWVVLASGDYSPGTHLWVLVGDSAPLGPWVRTYG